MSQEELKNSPIGVFDSGVGGLTVVAELLKALPHEDIVYFGDVGRTPYGIRSKDIIVKFTRQNIRFLMEHKVKYIVAACNSASAAALDTVREEFDIPLLGVIDPGAKAATGYTRNKRVGIIGTPATIGSDSYVKAIQKIDESIKVFSLACPLFVPLAEEGYVDKEATLLIAQEYLTTLVDVDIDTLVLGCTHYPLLKNVIRTVMGPNVRLVDSAEETASQVAANLKTADLLRDGHGTPNHKFYVSDVPGRFAEAVRRFLGQDVSNLTRVDITQY